MRRRTVTELPSQSCCCCCCCCGDSRIRIQLARKSAPRRCNPSGVWTLDDEVGCVSGRELTEASPSPVFYLSSMERGEQSESVGRRHDVGGRPTTRRQLGNYSQCLLVANDNADGGDECDLERTTSERLRMMHGDFSDSERSATVHSAYQPIMSRRRGSDTSYRCTVAPPKDVLLMRSSVRLVLSFLPIVLPVAVHHSQWIKIFSVDEFLNGVPEASLTLATRRISKSKQHATTCVEGWTIVGAVV